MLNSRPRRLVATLGVLIIAIGGYLGWQIYQGQQMAYQYAADAQKQAQESGDGSGSSSGTGSANSETQSSKEKIGEVPADQTPPTDTSTSTSPAPSSPVPQTNSGAPSSPSGTPASGEYKQTMSTAYQQALQAMQNVKGDTLALQGGKLSLSAYNSSILQAQATFSTAEAFVRANPPTESRLIPSYQEFLAGISLARQAMGVVLKATSSFSVSNFHAAREMGKTAQQQMVNGYSRL